MRGKCRWGGEKESKNAKHRDRGRLVEEESRRVTGKEKEDRKRGK